MNKNKQNYLSCYVRVTNVGEEQVYDVAADTYVSGNYNISMSSTSGTDLSMLDTVINEEKCSDCKIVIDRGNKELLDYLTDSKLKDNLFKDKDGFVGISITENDVEDVIANITDDDIKKNNWLKDKLLKFRQLYYRENLTIRNYVIVKIAESRDLKNIAK